VNLNNIKKTITAIIVSVLLSYVLITTKDLLTRIIVIPFLLFAISFFIRNICIMFNKKKLAKIFAIINVIAFFIYFFGFLIYWDYTSIINKNYTALVFSLIPWIGGCYFLYRRIKRFKK